MKIIPKQGLQRYCTAIISEFEKICLSIEVKSFLCCFSLFSKRLSICHVRTLKMTDDVLCVKFRYVVSKLQLINGENIELL